MIAHAEVAGRPYVVVIFDPLIKFAPPDVEKDLPSPVTSSTYCASSAVARCWRGRRPPPTHITPPKAGGKTAGRSAVASTREKPPKPTHGPPPLLIRTAW